MIPSSQDCDTGVPFEVPRDYSDALRIQSESVKLVRPTGRLPLEKIRTIAGADCSFGLREKFGTGGITVHRFPSLELIDQSVVRSEVPFPYIPGLLSFREIPLLLDAWRRLKVLPDVILCDGQGIAHPRGIGLASHLGVVLGIPTIGVAKSRLVGEYGDPGAEKGDWSFLYFEGRRVGAVVRTRTDTKPVFVSPGHLVGIRNAVRLTIECCPRYRITEPIRSAHRIVGELRKTGLER